MTALSDRVRQAIAEYADNYEAELADLPERFRSHASDYRERNAKLNPDKVQLFFVPVADFEQVIYHYDDVFDSVPWRKLIPVVVYKETAKLLTVGNDSSLDDLRRFRRGAIEEPGDAIDLGDLYINTDVHYAFRQIPKTELGVAIFRTAQEAFDSLPAAHKISRAEMKHHVADARRRRDAKLLDEDKARRAHPCAGCGELIGPDRPYAFHLGGRTSDLALKYIHMDCRTCEVCGEVIAGEYVYTDVMQDTQPQRIGSVTICSGPNYTEKLYYHARCAYDAGIKPHHGGILHREYGFHLHTAEHDAIPRLDKTPTAGRQGD